MKILSKMLVNGTSLFINPPKKTRDMKTILICVEFNELIDIKDLEFKEFIKNYPGAGYLNNNTFIIQSDDPYDTIMNDLKYRANRIIKNLFITNITGQQWSSFGINPNSTKFLKKIHRGSTTKK